MNKKVLIYYPNTGGYNFTPPYESLFLIKALEKFKDRIIFVDASKSENPPENYLEETEIVIITTLIKYTSITITLQVKDGIEFSKIAAKKQIPVIWTGMAAILLEKVLFNHCPNDVLIKCKDEKFLQHFLEQYFISDNRNDLKIFYEKVINTYIPAKNTFEHFGDFDFSFINPKLYIHNNTFDYIATTGCVNNCSFCSVPALYQRIWSHNSVNNIIRHLKYLFTNYPEIKVIHFRDDNFLVSRKFVFELFDELKNNNLNFIWSCQTSVNILKLYSDPELEKLYEYGCRNISIGVESGDEFILSKVTKSKTNIKESKKTIHRLLKNKITVSVTSIISFPYNNSADFNKTLKLLMKLKLLYPQLSMYCTIFQPIPKTEIFNEIFENKTYSDDILANNTWTSKKRKLKLKKFESFYFVFDNLQFYKTLDPSIAKDLKLLNLIFAPLIKLRFLFGISSLLWEYEITKKIIDKIKKKHGISSESILSEVGIRHLTSNFNFGFYKKVN